MKFTYRSNKTDKNKPAGPGCKLGITLFFLVFFLMGLFFSLFMIREGFRTMGTYLWKETPCTITVSYVDVRDSNDKPYRFIVQYRYDVDGRSVMDGTYKRSYGGGGDYTKAFRLSETYSKGSRSVCFVNPADPEEAVLKRDTPLTLLFVFFPLIFVAIGAGGIYAVWSKRFSRGSITSRARKIDPGSGKMRSRLQLGVFLLLLFLGGFLSWKLCYKPVGNIMTAGSRIEVPCLVQSSHVRSHEGDDSTTYSVDILYEYELGGKTCRSNRYGFIGGSSSGYHGKKALVDRYAPGTRHTCYVNPRDPYDAVLDPHFKPIYLILLIPVFVFVVGLLGTWSQLKKLKSWSGKTPFRMIDTGVGTLSQSRERPVTLKSAASPFMKWIGSIIFCLFWNGIISIFLWQAWLAWKSDRPEWFLMIFLIPFVLVGLASIVFVFYFFLAMFNPRPQITLESNRLTPGISMNLHWKIQGRKNVIRSLMITLEGREEATYRRGTDTRTDKKIFSVLPVFSCDHGIPASRGNAALSIPLGTMHSFESTHNKIVWYIRVHGAIDRWPDMEEEYPVEILPIPEREIQE